MKTITAKELFELQKRQPIDLIDVRTPMEFRGVHATIARNVPLDSLDADGVAKSRTTTAEEPLYVICQSGARGSKACQRLMDAGLINVVNVEGGTSAWDSAGLPVTRGKVGMSLERQVRLTAGLIVLASGLLALVVDPRFAIIAALMGGGLAFAAITNSCLMGMCLAKMPWNQSH